MPATIVTTYKIHITAPPESVWDFTQDFSKRHLWDKTILSAKSIQEHPRIIAVKGIGALTTELHYKLDERPNKTSLAMFNTKSPLIIGGGGYWHYEAHEGGTLWTQTNSLILKKNIIFILLSPVIKLMLNTNTRRAMQAAKKMIEASL
ncbi:MAG: SRPBCC family protein [Bacteroidetes bacterium]|nr:SRPBCC family protein [Bacteroidota bacterium]